MKDHKYSISIIIFSFIFISCNNCTEPISNDALFNIWVKYDEDISDPNTFRSANKLDDNRYGFIIERGGTFIHRKNVGGCGTPPITYGNYEGTWKELSENLLEITVDSWLGTSTFKIEILSVDESELRINFIYEYEENE